MRTALPRAVAFASLLAACTSPRQDKAITGASFVERLPDVLVRTDSGRLACVPDQLSGLTLAAVADWEEVEPQSDARAGGWSIAHGFRLDAPSPAGIGGWRIQDSLPRTGCARVDPDPEHEVILSRDAVAACVIGAQGWVRWPADIPFDSDPVVLVAIPGQIVALRPANESWWRVRDPTEVTEWKVITACDR
jgi:hypothetical protein